MEDNLKLMMTFEGRDGLEKRFLYSACLVLNSPGTEANVPGHIQGVSKKVPTFVLLLPQLPEHLERCFCTFFNSPAFVELKKNNIYIIESKFEKLLTKV